MTDLLRTKISRAAAAIARDFKTDEPEDAGLILIDLDELLDAVVRIADDQIHQLAGAPVEILRLPIRHHNAITRNGIRTVNQLAACTHDELLNTPGLGAAALIEITTALAARNHTLAPTRQNDKTQNAAAEGGDHHPTPPADFFQAHRTYIQNWPDAKPEHCTVFRCEAVTDFPGDSPHTAGLIAMGFSTSGHRPGYWSVYLCRMSTWREGWTEYDEAAG